MRIRNYCLAIFNRATYSRVASLLMRMEKDPEIRVTLIMGSGLVQEEYGEHSRYIRQQHKTISFHEIAHEEYSGEMRSCQVSADIMKEMSEFLSGKNYDAVILVADRFETLPATMVSAYMGFITIHILGGEVTGNIDERVRHACSKLADYHFAATKMAKEYLLALGEEPYTVHMTGCPSIDFIKDLGVRRYTPKEKYIICMFHPNTQSIETQYEETEILLKAVVDFCMKHGLVCYWYWPNPDPGREKILQLLNTVEEKYGAFIRKMVNDEPFVFLRRLSGAKFIIGNSSCGIREASYLGVPAINVGDRQSIRERSWNVLDCDLDYNKLIAHMVTQKAARRYGASYLYGDTKASQRMVQILKDIEYVKKGPLTYPLWPKFMEDHIGEKRFRKHKIGVQTGPKPMEARAGKGGSD